MNDPLLRAWTTQYTNSPMSPPQSMSSTFEKSRPSPRRKARRSCANCQRGHRTCDNNRPCEQCKTRGIPHKCINAKRKAPKYLSDSAYNYTPRFEIRPGFEIRNYGAETRAARRGDQAQCKPGGVGEARREAPTEKLPDCIDPSLLLHTENQTPRPTSGVGGNTVTALLRQGMNTSSPETVSSPAAPDAGGELDTPENIFEEILAELLAFDRVGINGHHGCNGLEGKEGKEASGNDGFAIGVGWSSTFYPPDRGV
ncbi:hypothetical protein BJX99DRAFT_263073 [Aspergillus californicus]